MKIKSRVINGVALALGTVFVSSAVYGAQININYGSARNPGSSGDGAYGGEFLITSSDGWAASIAEKYAASAKNLSGTGFETFCIEYGEHFSPGGNYDYQVSPGAIKGGQSVSDPISVGTGYIYSLFARGLLTGYDNDNATAGALQQTLWWLEGEQASHPALFDGLLIAQFGSLSDAQLDSDTVNGIVVNAAYYGVAALNLGGSPTWPNQDQLVYQPGGSQEVPEGGATLMLLGVAIGGLSFMRRKLG